MATFQQYVTALRDRQAVIGRKLGVELSACDKQTRVLNLAMLVLFAVVVKTLVDKGVITDADLTATLNAARDEVWPPQPDEPEGGTP